MLRLVVIALLVTGPTPGDEKDKATFLDLLDSERSLRDVKLRHYQALAQYESSVADHERAVGVDLRRKP